jgi:hypothetical protein
VAALQHLFDPAVDARDHPVGPGRSGRCQAVFDTRSGAAPDIIVPVFPATIG